MLIHPARAGAGKCQPVADSPRGRAGRLDANLRRDHDPRHSERNQRDDMQGRSHGLVISLVPHLIRQVPRQ